MSPPFDLYELDIINVLNSGNKQEIDKLYTKKIFLSNYVAINAIRTREFDFFEYCLSKNCKVHVHRAIVEIKRWYKLIDLLKHIHIRKLFEDNIDFINKLNEKMPSYIYVYEMLNDLKNKKLEIENELDKILKDFINKDVIKYEIMKYI
jgi:hypothetical protein